MNTCPGLWCGPDRVNTLEVIRLQCGFLITSAKHKFEAMTQFLHLTSSHHPRAIGQYDSYRFVAFSNMSFVATRPHDQQRSRIFDRRLMQTTMPVEIIPSQRYTNNFLVLAKDKFLAKIRQTFDCLVNWQCKDIDCKDCFV
jgi:hypothetical protein